MYLAALDPMSLVRALPGNVAQGIIWGIMALGVYITFRILDFADLTVDGSLATGGAVAVMLIRGGMNPALALLFAFLAGMAAGFASLRYVTGEGSELFFVKLIVAALILIAIIYWFFGTELGASIRATGCNPQMASAQGINTGFTKVLALMISNGLVGLSGGIYAQYQGAADVNMGRGAIVIGLAAVIISEVIFAKFCAGRKAAFAFTLGAIFIGAIIYYIVIALVLWLKMPSDYMKLFSAVVVACFLAVPYMKGKYFTKKRRTA